MYWFIRTQILHLCTLQHKGVLEPSEMETEDCLTALAEVCDGDCITIVASPNKESQQLFLPFSLVHAWIIPNTRRSGCDIVERQWTTWDARDLGAVSFPACKNVYNIQHLLY